jgi:hypothetical protein
MAGGPPLHICARCSVAWAPDEKSVYLGFGARVYRVMLPLRKAFPPLPPAGIESEAGLKAIPGATLLADFGIVSMTSDLQNVVASADPSTYEYVKATVHRNLYRIPIP